MKKTSYINYLTDGDIKEILSKMGYNAVPIVNKEGKLTSPISRVIGEDNKKDLVIVRCNRINPLNILDGLENISSNSNIVKYSKFLVDNLKDLSSAYNLTSNKGIIILSDYNFVEVFADSLSIDTEDEELDHRFEFVKHLASKLGEISEDLEDKYIDDYNAAAIEYNKNLDKHEEILEEDLEVVKRELDR